MKFRYVFLLALALVSFLAFGLFLVSKYVQPILPLGLDSDILLGATALVGVATLLASLKDIVELVEKAVGHKKLSENANAIEYTSKRNRLLRQKMIQKVNSIWIDGLLEASLHDMVMVELGLQYRADSVRYPWNLIVQYSHHSAKTLPEGTKVFDIIRKFGGPVLILGEPGSGKTITLLDLARSLLHVSKIDENQPIPIVLNLSSYTPKYQSLVSWLVDEMNLVYRVNKAVCRELFKTEEFYLLLDGLDEIKEEYQLACIEALNNFHQEYSLINTVVCSRIADYDALSAKLQIPDAVVIQPLTRQQIDDYLAAGEERLAAARAAVNADALLRELAQSPLNLSIIALVYQDKPLTELQTGNLEERRNHLFDAYVETMFQRRYLSHKISKQKAISTLSWLSYQLLRRSSTVFYIEKLQPDWLPTNKGRFFYQTLVRLVGIFLCTSVGGILGGLFGEPLIGFTTGIVAGLANVLFVSEEHIIPVERLSIPRNDTGRIDFGPLLEPAFGGLFFGLLVWISLLTLLVLLLSIFNQLASIENAQIALRLLILTLSVGVATTGIIGWLTFSEIENKSFPNQGMWLSGQNAVRIGSAVGFVAYLIASLTTGKDLGLISGIFVGLTINLFFGGNAFIRHFVLRFVLDHYSHLPGRLTKFLNTMCKLILMRKIGGGYIFVHRMLLEHFANLLIPEQQQEIQVAIRSSISQAGGTTVFGLRRISKLAMDYVICILGLVPLIPFILLITLFVKLDSPGPIFHRRRVMGINGREIEVYKFRTLYINSDEILTQHPDLQKELAKNHRLKNDPRITRVGHFLRKLSLDELPQLFNVLRGEMSLIGPRMISPSELAKYQMWGINLLTVPPGITGVWQLSGRSDMTYDERVQMDIEYIMNWSIWLDLKILVKTPLAVFKEIKRIK